MQILNEAPPLSLNEVFFFKNDVCNVNGCVFWIIVWIFRVSNEIEKLPLTDFTCLNEVQMSK